MRTAQTAGLAVVLGLLWAPASRAAEAPSVVNLWPLFYSKRDAGRREVEVLGPLVFYESGPRGRAYGLRPLFTVQRCNEPKKRSTVQVLYPLSYFRTEADARRHFVFPLFYHSRHIGAKKKPITATVLFPFFWFGDRGDDGPWFVIPLVGGVYKGLLGQDHGVHVSLLYNRMRTGDYVVHHVLWPFFTWSSNRKDHWSLRVWPFYGRGKHEGRWQSGYVLWPFFSYGSREASKIRDAASYFMVWPLYGRSRARDGQSGSDEVLWPFFRYVWNRKTGYRAWRMPWPLIVGSNRTDVRAFNAWPLYGRRSWAKGKSSESYYLWPLVHHTRVRATRSKLDDLKIFPLLTVTSRSSTAPTIGERPGGPAAARAESGTPTKRSRSFFLLWPLLRVRSRRAGEQWGREANSLQFAWFRNSESFDRTYNPLLGLFEHGASSDGRRATRLLWRMVRFERGKDLRHVQVGPLVSVTRSADLTRWSFLLGLVQTGRRHGRRGWRIFFIPFGASL